MVSNGLNRTIARESFEYGEHEVVVEVAIQNSLTGGYQRYVGVKAQTGGESEVVNRTWVRIDRLHPTLTAWDRLVCWLTGTAHDERLAAKRASVTPIENQIEDTVRPVLEELDTIYGFLDRTYDIDVEVGMDRVRHETSWAEVDTHIDRISRELGMEAEA